MFRDIEGERLQLSDDIVVPIIPERCLRSTQIPKEITLTELFLSLICINSLMSPFNM